MTRHRPAASDIFAQFVDSAHRQLASGSMAARPVRQPRQSSVVTTPPAPDVAGMASVRGRRQGPPPSPLSPVLTPARRPAHPPR
jgi:hypothetical protein